MSCDRLKLKITLFSFLHNSLTAKAVIQERRTLGPLLYPFSSRRSEFINVVPLVPKSLACREVRICSILISESRAAV